MALYNIISDDDTKKQSQNIITGTIDKSIPWDYFDGSSQQQGCGGGAILYLNDEHYYNISTGLGRDTNNYSELNNLRLLIFSFEKESWKL